MSCIKSFANLVNSPGKVPLNFVALVSYIVGSLIFAGMSMFFWLIIFNNQLDWWNTGKRWQRYFIGSAFVISISMIILTGILLAS